MCKVRKTQHQFGHSQGEIFKKPAQKSTLAFNPKTINFGDKLSFILSFLFLRAQFMLSPKEK